ncbi:MULTISPECIES: sel1 repeat family protein [unclassified Pseudomonas]|uniref:tetratricopeptide repeat protein n=1 Tax=unclassified Pseudomonas TaxID=196821 RepID=UPI002AC9BD05|nr:MULTISPECIES: sel1 repeat family protein [unclassified Pseudomonas]MEB0044202.1 sel1 repeat family protein [Pseudomonas sp. Dout3]MEB0094861.1 sel1 repeat family protein [Pseudomonas sp. DC1.2]WPX59778.1 sel1 repeat family protein [Pseudomonas sp. DC1.2]
MHHPSDAITALHTLISSINSLLSPLTEPQRAAQTRGLDLYHLGEYQDAEPALTIAAKAGDRDSQYALGEVIRRREGSISDNAKPWYRLAGAQDHVYSLMRLGDADSLDKARKLAQAGAEIGDGDAMLEMYELTQDIAWLKKAGTAACGEALYILAILYEKTPALVPATSDLSTMLDIILRRSAALGYPPAMYWLSNIKYLANVSYQERWLNKRLEHNHLGAVLTYSYALLHLFDTEQNLDRYDYSYDAIKGYGLLWLVVNSTRNYVRRAEAVEILANTGSTLTPEQIEAGKAFAEEWKNSHPPMSAYKLTYSSLQ